MIRDKTGKVLGGFGSSQNGNPKCGTCLMERTDITELRDDGTCPVCNPRKERERDRKNGQYAPSIDRLCVCGHTLGAHTAARVGGEQPCIMGDIDEGCDCKSFKRAKGGRQS